MLCITKCAIHFHVVTFWHFLHIKERTSEYFESFHDCEGDKSFIWKKSIFKSKQFCCPVLSLTHFLKNSLLKKGLKRVERYMLICCIAQWMITWLMRGSSHIQSVLIGVQYWNCCRTFDIHLSFAIWIGQIQPKLLIGLVKNVLDGM